MILGCVTVSLEFLLYKMEIVKGCPCPVHIPLAFTSLIVNSRNSWPEGFFCSHPSGGQAGRARDVMLWVRVTLSRVFHCLPDVPGGTELQLHTAVPAHEHTLNGLFLLPGRFLSFLLGPLESPPTSTTKFQSPKLCFWGRPKTLSVCQEIGRVTRTAWQGSVRGSCSCR